MMKMNGISRCEFSGYNDIVKRNGRIGLVGCLLLQQMIYKSAAYTTDIIYPLPQIFVFNSFEMLFIKVKL